MCFVSILMLWNRSANIGIEDKIGCEENMRKVWNDFNEKINSISKTLHKKFIILIQQSDCITYLHLQQLYDKNQINYFLTFVANRKTRSNDKYLNSEQT